MIFLDYFEIIDLYTMKKYTYLYVILMLGFVSCETEDPIPTYTLSTTVSPTEGGKIIVSPQSPNYKEGEVVTLTPEPNEHWVFKQWGGDGNGNSNPLQITMTSDKSVVGVFVKRDYLLKITIIGEGTVEEKIVSVPGGREYPHGTTVQLTPKPKEGWVFESWGGDLTGTETPRTIKVDKEKNVTVKFKMNPNFYLNANGVTCMCPNSQVGEKGIINGQLFESVDRELLIKRRNEGKDLTKVCTSLVKDMNNMFKDSQFNRPIGNWDVSSVTNMRFMFNQTPFNQTIIFWNVSNVTDMESMFQSSPFNQSINNWDVGKVINMKGMFLDSPFNQPLGNWNVSKVENMMEMFMGSKFNQPIGNWDVGKVINMGGMFWKSSFNQPIGSWNVSNVTVMESMFQSSPFNQPIGNWNVSKVTDMNRMFLFSVFNQPIGNWNVRNVTNMSVMFQSSQFNQNISKWCVTNLKLEPVQFSISSPLSFENKPKWGTCPD